MDPYIADTELSDWKAELQRIQDAAVAYNTKDSDAIDQAQQAYDAAAANEQKTAADLKKAKADYDRTKALEDAIKKAVAEAQAKTGKAAATVHTGVYVPKHMASTNGKGLIAATTKASATEAVPKTGDTNAAGAAVAFAGLGAAAILEGLRRRRHEEDC